VSLFPYDVYSTGYGNSATLSLVVPVAVNGVATGTTCDRLALQLGLLQLASEVCASKFSSEFMVMSLHYS
jgi:hypothetical protein